MTDNTAPTLSERYSRALSTSHMEVQARVRGDVDVIIAAGWVPEHMGTMLYRLAAEFDRAHGEVALAHRNHAEQQKTVTHYTKLIAAEKRKTPRDDSLIAKWETRIEQLQKEIERDMKARRAFILLKTKSLPAVKVAFANWATGYADKRGFLSDSERRSITPAARAAVIQALSHRVLDIMLDPMCPRCEGRGFNGGYDGVPQVICRVCEAGRRKPMARHQDEDVFADGLRIEAEIMLLGVDRLMKKWLRDDE